MSEEKKDSKTEPKKFVASVADESTGKEPGETVEEKLPGFVLETDRVLNPISKENPAGEHLIYEGTYDRIQEARREDDASIPVGVWERELKKSGLAKGRRYVSGDTRDHLQRLASGRLAFRGPHPPA